MYNQLPEDWEHHARTQEQYSKTQVVYSPALSVQILAMARPPLRIVQCQGLTPLHRHDKCFDYIECKLVANCDRFKALKHSTINPYAFTEQGMSMLSSVLKSDRAIQVNIHCTADVPTSDSKR